MQDFRGHPHGAGFLSCITNGCKQQLGTTHVYYNAGFFGSLGLRSAELRSPLGHCSVLAGSPCVCWLGSLPRSGRVLFSGWLSAGSCALSCWTSLWCLCAAPPSGPQPSASIQASRRPICSKPCGCHVVLGVAVAHFVPVSCSIMFWRREVLQGLH